MNVEELVKVNFQFPRGLTANSSGYPALRFQGFQFPRGLTGRK